MNKLKHTLIVAGCVAIASQFHIDFFVQGFIITLSVILLPVLLYNYSELNPISAAFVTGIVSPVFRGIIVYLTNGDIDKTIAMVGPDVAFYFAYGIFFYLIYYRNEKRDLTVYFITVFACDFLSNMVEMSFRTRILGMDFTIIKGLLIIATVRSLIVIVTIVSMKQYRSFLVQEEHENRYRKLMLLTSSFKSEIYFMNKNINEIEDVMKKSYMVYKFLDENSCHNEIKDMALDIAKDVHEIKKDYISVIRGLEGMSKDNIDVTFMNIRDIISILEQDTKEYIKSNKLDIDIGFKIDAQFTVKDHFYLMAVLRNLVNNSIEAIGSRRGLLELSIYSDTDGYVFKVSDNGSGIKESNLDFIFNPGFSTKFDKSTGKIERGLGLTLVRDLVRDKFEGEISVKSEESKGATFMIRIPKHVFRSE